MVKIVVLTIKCSYTEEKIYIWTTTKCDEDEKDIQVIVKPISLEFGKEIEGNYQKSGGFGWFHKSLDVSFGIVEAEYAHLRTNHKAHDISEAKKTNTKGSTDGTTHKTTKTMNGGVQVAVPQFLTLKGGRSYESSTCKSTCGNVGEAIEQVYQETQTGFMIIAKPNKRSST